MTYESDACITLKALHFGRLAAHVAKFIWKPT